MDGLGALRPLLVGDGGVGGRMVAGVVDVDDGGARGVVRVEVDGRRSVRVEMEIVIFVGVLLGGAELDVGSGVGARVGVAGGGGDGGRGRGDGERGEGVSLSVGGEGKDRGAPGDRVAAVEEAVERGADGAEGAGVRRVRIRKSVAVADGIGEQESAFAAQHDRLGILELRLCTTHDSKRERDQEKPRRQGSRERIIA